MSVRGGYDGNVAFHDQPVSFLAPTDVYESYDSDMISISKARDSLADLVNRVAYGHERILLGRRGKTLAALISADDLELLEQLEDASDLRAAQAALAAPENRAEAIPWQDLEAEIDARR
jgi:prevent-host-death family protein